MWGSDLSDIFKNNDFVNWSGIYPDGFTGVGPVLHGVHKVGTNSVLLNTATISYDVDQIEVLSGKKIVIETWVYATQIGTVEAYLNIDGVVHSSGLNQFTNSWEILTVEVVVPENSVIATFSVGADSDGQTVGYIGSSFFNLDGDIMLDYDDGEIVIEGSIEITPEKGLMRMRDTFDFDIEFLEEITDNYIKNVNLLPLVPENFRSTATPENSSFILEDFIAEMNRYVGGWLSKIEEIGNLQNPYTVDEKYIDYLAASIGVELIKDSTSDIRSLQHQLAESIDWIKIKGTYQSMQVALYLTGFKTNVYDLYTNDYVEFIRTEWFVGSNGENPPGLTPDYFKSPHFLIETVLDTAYGSIGSQYLLSTEKIETIMRSIEAVRPVNTVPNYSFLLNPIANGTQTCNLTTELISSRVTDVWSSNVLNLDDGLDLDSGKLIDGYGPSLYASVKGFKLGNGNIGRTPCDIDFTGLENEIYSGVVDSYTEDENSVDFFMTVPKSVAIQDAREFVILLEDGETAVGYATFPTVTKPIGTELLIKFTVLI